MDLRSPSPIALNRLMAEVNRLRLNRKGGVDVLARRYHDPANLQWLRERMDARQWTVIVERYDLMRGGRGLTYAQIGQRHRIAAGMAQKVHRRALQALAWLVDTHEGWLLWHSPDEAVRMTAPVELLLEVNREHKIAPDGIMKSMVAVLRRTGVENLHQVMELGLHGLSQRRGFKHGVALQYLQTALEILELIPASE